MSRSYYLEQGGFYTRRNGPTFDKDGLVSSKIVIEDAEVGEYYIPICKDTLTVALNVAEMHRWYDYNMRYNR
jgi:hypothetical protein